MKCPKCGSTLRASKKQPGSYLCDTCKKRFRPNVSSKKRKQKAKRKKLLRLLVISLLVVCAAVLFVKFKPSIIGKSESDNYAVGQIASANGIELQITDFAFSNGTDEMKPSTGKKFILLNVTVSNESKEIMNLHTLSAFRLIADDKPVEYSSYVYEAEAANIKRLPESLEAGASFNGTVAFEIPAKASKLILQYANPIWSSDKLVFDIE